MKQLLNRLPKWARSFYFLAALFFLIWMLFFDSNDIFTQTKSKKKLKELEEEKEYYLDKIEEVKENREALLNDEELLERIAREKYFMKKEGEDVFVVTEGEEE